MTLCNSRNQPIRDLPRGGRRPPLLSLRELATEAGLSAQRMSSAFANHPEGRPDAVLKNRGGTSATYFVAANLRAWWKKVSS